MARIKNRVWQWLAGIIVYTCSAFALAAPTWASIEKITEGEPDAAGLKNLTPLIDELSDSAVFDTFLQSAEFSRTQLAADMKVPRQQVAKVRQQVAKVRQQVAKVRQQSLEQPVPNFKEPPTTGKKSAQAPQQQVTYVVGKR
jgi:hypothetical protein